MMYSQKIDIINQILQRMRTEWTGRSRFATEQEFNQLVDLYNQGQISDECWRDYELPVDKNNKPITVFPSDGVYMSRRMYTRLYVYKYCKQKHIRPMNWLEFHFYISAEDIIKMHVPPCVAVCTGHAKVFCHLARQAGLKCMVVTSSLYSDGHVTHGGGHNFIAVELDGKLVSFNPEYPFTPIDGDVKIGKTIKCMPDRPEQLITAIRSSDAFLNLQSGDDIYKQTAVQKLYFKRAKIM